MMFTCPYCSQENEINADNGLADCPACGRLSKVNPETLSPFKTIDQASKRLRFILFILICFVVLSLFYFTVKKGNTQQSDDVPEEKIDWAAKKINDSISEAQYHIAIEKQKTEEKATAIAYAKSPLGKIQNRCGCTKEEAETILHHHVEIGFTKEMCIAAWGKPYDINTTQGANYYTEQWVYNMKTYLYFDGTGKLYSIQN